ncbi:MAG: Fe-S cluster assembly sulfur transfer protein SufU [Rhodospirillaceae bacterium]
MSGSNGDEDLIALYQGIILDHGRNPRNKGCIPNHTCLSEGRNPLCGDRVAVTALIKNDVLTDVRFDGRGCAISIASASMMTVVLSGQTKKEAKRIFEFVKLLCTEDIEPNQLASSVDGELEPCLQELMSLSGVRKFPVRVKCATLPWYAFMSCLDGKKTATTENVPSQLGNKET